MRFPYLVGPSAAQSGEYLGQDRQSKEESDGAEGYSLFPADLLLVEQKPEQEKEGVESGVQKMDIPDEACHGKAGAKMPSKEQPE